MFINEEALSAFIIKLEVGFRFIHSIKSYYDKWGFAWGHDV